MTLMNFYKMTIVLALIHVAGTAFAVESQQIWEVSGTDAEGASQVAHIVERRFKKIKPGFFDSVSAQANGNLVLLHFSGWRPTSKQLNALTQTTGKLCITLASAPDQPLITDKDIEQAEPLRTSEIAIRLSDSATLRVTARTANAAEDVVVMQWDGQIIERLRIAAAPLQRDLAFSVPSREDAQIMSAVLSSGRMPEGVSLKAR